MSGYDNFKIRTMLDGENSRQAKIKDAKHILSLEFKNDPSYCETMFLWIPGVNPHKDEQIDIRLFDRKYSAANGFTTKFEVQIDTNIDIGYYYFNDELKQYWICTELFNVNDIYISGKLTMCNWFLRWQNLAGEIIEYPCSDINSTQYNSGESGDKTMTLGSAQHMVTVQLSPETIGIRTPLRFFVSKDYSIPFKVTQNDTISNNYGNGLCKITLTQDQLNPETDRPDIGLCDYIPSSSIDEPSQSPDPDETTDLFAEILYKNDPELKAGGTNKTFTGVFRSKPDEIINEIGVWDVIVVDELLDYVQYTVNENTLKIRVLNDPIVIGGIVRIVFSAKDKTVSKYMDLKITSII